jgi:GTP cyclohydrolase II
MTVVLELPEETLVSPNESFVETKLNTQSGCFNIRVYSDELNKETVVLWTDDINLDEPVLVRVHSECLTGDTIGSLHCDCGKQLQKSLQMMQEEGGVLIYLRQEGRGIGLFEKIKAYQLQAKGYDTFEANVLLGHRPDERTYQIAKTALDDLKIKRIRLLTNNPSKISELSKLGIEVVEQVPLIIRSNKFNKKYFETKKNKFKHIFNGEQEYYFCQFPIDTADEVKQINEFIKDRKKDPLLKIFVGISCSRNTLFTDKEIIRIRSIFKACEEHSWIIPILHFSFQNSGNPIRDVEKVKEKLPFVNRIQLNDLSDLNVNFIEKALGLFIVDIPLPKKHFEIIKNKRFRKLVKKNNLFVTLDNSQGRGVKESQELIRSRIDSLLSYGLNNIVLCGGFGPDELDVYFAIRRYYRINFSIDAETKLKTDGKVDLEKIKLYLLQIMRFDDPNVEGISQTKEFLRKQRRSKWDEVVLEGKNFKIHPKVFHSGYFKSTAWFAGKVCERVAGKKSFCEIGCGSGVISCSVALDDPKIEVVATDINPFASENTKLNAKELGIKNRVKTFTGDVLDSIPLNQRFDCIFWALPFGFLDPGTEINLEDLQVFDPGYRAIRKFFHSAKNSLKPNGQLLIGFSKELGHFELLQELAKESNLQLQIIEETELTETEKVKFQIYRGTYQK